VNRIDFAASQLALVPVRRDPWVHAQAVAVVEAAEPVERERRDLIDSIESAVARALPRVPLLREHAEALWISERTLRRRLSHFETTYEAIVDAVRSATARRLITQSAEPLGSIAREVGFSDTRALRRAVIRWTGSSPSALRASSASK
jgi:AraC-like DNA-binding protein